jgi:hypothetical protein
VVVWREQSMVSGRLRRDRTVRERRQAGALS